MLALERHNLQTCGGSLTENFYSLKRERVVQIKGHEIPRASLGTPQLTRDTLALRKSDVWKSLAALVGLPYLTRKINESYEIHVPQTTTLGSRMIRDRLPPNPTMGQRLQHYYKSFLSKIYPSIHATYVFGVLAFNIAYLFDNSKYSSPLLWLIGTRLRRLSEADHRMMAVNARQPAAASPGPARVAQSNSILVPQSLYPCLLSYTRLLLPASIFALKFLEWWHASDFARQLSRKVLEGLELPPPLVTGSTHQMAATNASRSSQPGMATKTNTVSLSNTESQNCGVASFQSKLQHPRSKSSGLPILTVPAPSSTSFSSSNALCPVCLYPVQTPTAVQTGYVFCYTCIFKWIDGSHERQTAFLEGDDYELEWERYGQSEVKTGRTKDDREEEQSPDKNRKMHQWDLGQGRCPVTGRKGLGGTDGLRRLVV